MTSRIVTSHTETTLSLVDDILGGYAPRDFQVRLWDGSTWGPGPGQPHRFTLVLCHPGSLRRMLMRPTELNLAECYIYGDIDVEGDLHAVMPLGSYLMAHRPSLLDRLQLTARLLLLPAAGQPDADGGPLQLRGAPHSLERDRQAVRSHYDVSNDFYRLWLDDSMVYSCAYFADAGEDLDTAQRRKLDLLCRKLRLQPGERLLDIGCGWGGLLRHAVRGYGVEAVGITLSQRQAEEARQRLERDGLADRCQVRVQDYRELADDEGFDKIVSVGMVEHVGGDHLDEYFAQVHRLLRPGGTFLNHGIGRTMSEPDPEPGFVRTYVFPDSDLPALDQIVYAAEDHGFEPRDVENLREHYALTLRHWVARLEANREAAVDEVGEVAYRTWRLYMAGCAHWFRCGEIAIYQTLLLRQRADGSSDLPLTRLDWYRLRSRQQRRSRPAPMRAG